MEVVIPIAAKIVKYTVAPIGQWLCYSLQYNSNIENMKNREEKLRRARISVQSSIAAAIRNGEEIEAYVNKWFADVDDITELARKVCEGEEEAKKKCYNVACLNLKQRHQLSQKAKKIAQDIDELLENGRFDKVSHRPAPQGMVTTRFMDYLDFESRMSTVKGLMEALEDAKINVIGMWGMAGVGKTTLVREVARQAKEEKLFDKVAMAFVTQSPDLGRIQGEIADELDLKLDAETVRGRANHLCERLKKDKVLVILDDIWEKLDLEAIGIPCMDCKVVLISRQHDSLFCEMGTQKDFVLDFLLEEEAWTLFEKIAGDSVKDPNIRYTATEVAKECGCLPFALVTVSKALKNKSSYEWKDALQLLRKPAPEHLTRMQSTIYSSIELSYSHLESQELQYFFLHCAQMGYSINYRDLLKYCYGLGLFRGINTLEEARNRLYRLVRNLRDSCLLLDCPHTSEHCHMHDLVRDVAALIASKDHNMFVVRDEGGLREWPDGDALIRCKAFSIRGGDIHQLPKECPELRFFYVYGGDRSLEIQNNFFQGMEKLEVLDLTKIQLPSLPSSLPHLRNLQTLCLDQCVLGDISIIGELKNLVILSLLKSNISQLPRQIGSLTRLRLLDLSDCSKLEVIPPNLLSSLGQLEDLYMGNSFVQWEAEGLSNERNNASLSELKHLSQKLITLEIHVREASVLPKDLLFEKLERYRIFVGDVWDWSDKHETSRKLKLKLNTSFQLEFGIKMLLKRTEDLHLDELKGVKSVLRELDRDGFQQLKHLHIQNNAEIKHIINSSMPLIAFPILETLLLKNMIDLEEICHGQLDLTSFSNLRVLKVEHCQKLKFVYSSSIAKGLSLLEELEIRECSIMTAIVMKEEDEIEDGDMILFPRLRTLVLEHLPKLMSFLSTKNSFITDAGEIIPEGNLDFDMPILQEQVVFPNLERLKLSSVAMEATQHNQHRARFCCTLTNVQAMSRFQNLSSLDVVGYGNIKFLLSLSTARSMVHLKHLHILECKVMEEVLVLSEEIGIEEERLNLFPRLECLILEDLPILKRFCKGINIEFPSLRNLRLEHCPRLKTFIIKLVSSDMTVSNELKEMNAEESLHTVMQPLFNEAVAFPSLERLVIARLDDLKIIWQNQFAEGSFGKLQFITVVSCANLVNIFPASVARCLIKLEEIRIGDCGVEEIVACEGAEATTKFLFRQVTVLWLQDLPRLKWLYPCVNASEWPMLKDMWVCGCPKVEIFASELLRSRETHVDQEISQREISNKQPLFLVDEATFPNLEKLRLQHYHTIWDGQFLEEYFAKLKAIEVICDHSKSAVSPSQFLKRLCNLEKLLVHHSYWEEIFPYEEFVGREKNAPILPRLRELQLSELFVLTHLWKEDTQPCPIFPNLEILEVSKCPKLKILVPSSVSFRWLSNLQISKCNFMVNLVTSSTAKSLVQLKKMSVSECERIIEIVAREGGEANDQVITFSKLTYLKLDCLPNLSNFCSGNYSFVFPSLEEVIVRQCPEMKIFSHGVLSAPKLERVQATKEDEWHWKDDLNTTIHWLLESKV